MEEDTKLDPVHPKAEGFVECVTHKTPPPAMHFMTCPKCKGVHYRHAGYVNIMLPYLKSGGDKRVSLEEQRVLICVACHASFIWTNEQAYCMDEHIDVKAWEKSEKVVHEATGPGGQC